MMCKMQWCIFPPKLGRVKILSLIGLGNIHPWMISSYLLLFFLLKEYKKSFCIWSPDRTFFVFQKFCGVMDSDGGLDSSDHTHNPEITNNKEKVRTTELFL